MTRVKRPPAALAVPATFLKPAQMYNHVVQEHVLEILALKNTRSLLAIGSSRDRGGSR